jgi:hypothetical protein
MFKNLSRAPNGTNVFSKNFYETKGVKTFSRRDSMKSLVLFFVETIFFDVGGFV